MRWRTGRRSDNIEDRRDSDSGNLPFGTQRPLRVGRRVGVGGGLGGLLLVIVLLFLGVDPSLLLTDSGQIAIPQQAPIEPSGRSPFEPGPSQTTNRRASGQDELADFVSVILADTEDTWGAIFRERGERYSDPKLVMYTGMTRSACGLGKAAMGPFYCPADRKVYIDLDFYRELRDGLGAHGDFAQAYVIAHEIGHHVQNLLGISDQVDALRQRASQTEANALSVRLELQADCFAGLWAKRAHQARDILEQGDIEEGLNAASAIGDDHLQRQSRGYVRPDSFTHGSSAQRVRWFKRGLDEGTLAACDTFADERR
ncbi:neutral zinc metallopeptidase [uncultured Thiocystis sp.]|jgi:predicted metalloprotease|uniref:KPN_02809 family neutral zinc metallopeptidase n=1 Tax=uncultured Thiocystis sp. TaxID=1202134 RepID=UPI0025E62268|nr:neutral zinc metallopeptidase [uncultured Thiocystis sp.]